MAYVDSDKAVMQIPKFGLLRGFGTFCFGGAMKHLDRSASATSALLPLTPSGVRCLVETLTLVRLNVDNRVLYISRACMCLVAVPCTMSCVVLLQCINRLVALRYAESNSSYVLIAYANHS